MKLCQSGPCCKPTWELWVVRWERTCWRSRRSHRNERGSCSVPVHTRKKVAAACWWLQNVLPLHLVRLCTTLWLDNLIGSTVGSQKVLQ